MTLRFFRSYKFAAPLIKQYAPTACKHSRFFVPFLGFSPADVFRRFFCVCFLSCRLVFCPLALYNPKHTGFFVPSYFCRTLHFGKKIFQSRAAAFQKKNAAARKNLRAAARSTNLRKDIKQNTSADKRCFPADSPHSSQSKPRPDFETFQKMTFKRI